MLNKFSLSEPQQMYGEQYREYAYWWYALKSSTWVGFKQLSTHWDKSFLGRDICKPIVILSFPIIFIKKWSTQETQVKVANISIITFPTTMMVSVFQRFCSSHADKGKNVFQNMTGIWLLCLILLVMSKPLNYLTPKI